ncbi:hypothetical protein ACGFOU_25470 [Streptomyces sp. NPDC048595]|uniref:hypothetical protein n=1 Tax=Streptomyces sp. NPDC048595 TaxID=3365576 RepID=UPI0037232314
MIRSFAPARPAYLRVVRVSAWYDLVIAIGFVTPWTYVVMHDALSSLAEAWGLGAVPEFDVWQTLYANLMGSVVLIWSVLRIARTLPVYGVFDGVGRMLFSAWMAYALAHGASRIVWLFFGVELAFGVVQLVPWWRSRGPVDLAHAHGRPADAPVVRP